jgi:hypothetical protein
MARFTASHNVEILGSVEDLQGILADESQSRPEQVNLFEPETMVAS